MTIRQQRIFPLVALTAIVATACGGGATTQQMQTNEPGLVAAPATDSMQGQVPDNTVPTIVTDTTGNSDGAVPDSTPTHSNQPVATPDTNASGQPDSVPVDTAVLENAGNVGCEAAPALFNDTMLALINASRIEARMCGDNSRDPAPPVTWNNKLAQAAVAHGQDMAMSNFFSHTGSDGLAVSDRVETADYQWRAVGENIAAGQLEQAEVHQGWLDSPGHCMNIMNKVFTEVGAACVRDSGSDFGTYWVVVFGDVK